VGKKRKGIAMGSSLEGERKGEGITDKAETINANEVTVREGARGRLPRLWTPKRYKEQILGNNNE